MFTNEANSHKPIDLTLAVGLNPGPYSLALVPSSATETDGSDSFAITVVNLG